MGKPDFGPGDLVVCVNAKTFIAPSGHILAGGDHLVEGRAYRCVWVGKDLDGDPVCLVDSVKSRDPTGHFYALRFRKIDKADESFTAQIRACRPVPGKVPA